VTSHGTTNETGLLVTSIFAVPSVQASKAEAEDVLTAEVSPTGEVGNVFYNKSVLLETSGIRERFKMQFVCTTCVCLSNKQCGHRSKSAAGKPQHLSSVTRAKANFKLNVPDSVDSALPKNFFKTVVSNIPADAMMSAMLSARIVKTIRNAHF
jgi:hypothetical protein